MTCKIDKSHKNPFFIFFSFDILTLSHQGPQLSTKNTAAFLLSTIIGGEKEEGNTCESIYQERKQVSLIQGVILVVAEITL